MKTKNGFTLIELLVVLGILVLSLSIVAPLLGNTIKNYQIKSATREIAAGLRETRSKAVNSETEKTLILDIRQKQYSIDPLHSRHKIFLFFAIIMVFFSE